MKALLLTISFIVSSIAWGADAFTRFDQVDPDYILIASHRCGYISNGTITHPENSLTAAQNTMDLGVEILETDIHMTSDGGLVLMHDTTVNRTTDGSGTVSAMTLAQVRALHLMGPGGVTTEIVPTLTELMMLVKGKAMVNLDKVDINNIALRDAIMTVLIATDTVDHAIFKGGASASQVDDMRAAYPGETIHYMPVLSNSSESSMISMLNAHTPPATELIFNSSSTTMLSPSSLSTATTTDTHIWINSLWSSLCAGHHDAIALGGNPDGSWGWLIDKQATIIQTDNAPQLITYLESKGLRANTIPPPTPAPAANSYFFDDGTRQGWTNTRTGSGVLNPARFEARTNQGKGGGHSPDYSLLHDGNDTWLNGRDIAHDTLVCRSPAFDFDESATSDWKVSFFLLGGTGNTTSQPTSTANLPIATSDGGFMGVALRRVSDGAYILYDHRDTSNQNDAWEAQGWSQAEMVAAISGDAADETYQLDLIDQNHGGWGWLILDTVMIEGVALPVVSLTATDDTGGEFGDNNQVVFSLTRTGSTAEALEVPITFSGTASAGSDFSTPAPSVIFPQGITTVTLPLDIFSDDLGEGDETIIATISDNNDFLAGTPDSATATVTDSPYGAWIFSHWGPSTAPPLGSDDDNDSFEDQLEYFWGSDPKDPNSQSQLVIAGNTNEIISIHYKRALDRPDVMGYMEWSTNLTTWHLSGETDGVRTVDVVETIISSPDENPETIEASFTTTTGPSTDQIFFRLHIEATSSE